MGDAVPWERLRRHLEISTFKLRFLCQMLIFSNLFHLGSYFRLRIHLRPILSKGKFLFLIRRISTAGNSIELFNFLQIEKKKCTRKMTPARIPHDHFGSVVFTLTYHDQLCTVFFSTSHINIYIHLSDEKHRMSLLSFILHFTTIFWKFYSFLRFLQLFVKYNSSVQDKR